MAKDDGYDYIRQYYKVPVKVGQHIEVNGKTGTVIRPKRANQYVRVRFDDGSEGPCHPTWETVYFNPDGSIVADYRAQKEAKRVG